MRRVANLSRSLTEILQKQLILRFLIILLVQQSRCATSALSLSMSTNKPPVNTPPMNAIYDKVSKKLQSHLNQPAGQQYWVAIAGGPGSGKTTSAEAIAERLNAAEPNSCLVIPMDGFHYSKEKLKELDPPDGEEFLRRRGAPWTFDAELCVQLLTDAKKSKRGVFPTYDRVSSDPVPHGVELFPEHTIVLVEGLYVMWKDDERWAPLDALWDERLFIKAPSLDEQRQRLIGRSLKTWSKAKSDMWGPGVEGVTARVDANDALNMQIVAPCEAYADTVIVTS